MEAETGQSSTLVTLRSVSCDSLAISAQTLHHGGAGFARRSPFAGSERTNNAASEADVAFFMCVAFVKWKASLVLIGDRLRGGTYAW